MRARSGLRCDLPSDHALLLAVGAGLVLFFGWQIPVRFEQGGEFVGGCLLISARPVRRLADASRAVSMCTRMCTTTAIGAHNHWHLHIRPPALASPRDSHGAAWSTGARFRGQRPSRARFCRCRSGMHRGGSAASRCAAVSRLLFAVGILMSMSLFGIVLAHTLADRRMTGHVARFSAAATALGSLALGVYWITGL